MNEQGCTECVTIIRPSFKRFLDSDPCRAATFNHLLYWIAKKAKGQESDKVKSGEVYWYGSADDIRDGLDQNWSLWKIRKEVEELVKAFIGRRHNQAKGWDREYQYFFGEEQGKALREACKKLDICLLHLGLHPDVVHLLKTVNAIDENSKCNCRKPQMDLLNSADPFTENSGAIPKDTTKVSSKGLQTKVTNREREAPPSSQSSNASHTLSSNSHDESQEKRPPVLIQHPEHHFIFLDDPDKPTTLFVQFGDPDDEHGFNHRAHTSRDVQCELEERLGYKLVRKSSFEQPVVQDAQPASLGHVQHAQEEMPERDNDVTTTGQGQDNSKEVPIALQTEDNSVPPSSNTSTCPIAILSDVAQGNGQSASAQGYTTSDSETSMQVSEPPDNDASINATPPMVEVGKVTQASKTVQPTLLDAPLAEPTMSGPWTAEKVVQYAEFRNGKRYAEKQRKTQIEAARVLHRNDPTLSLEQFKIGYDERNDAWWQERNVHLHVSHMKAEEGGRGASGVDRLHAALLRVEKRSGQKSNHGRVESIPSPPTQGRDAYETLVQHISTNFPELRFNHFDEFGGCMQLWHGTEPKDYWLIRDMADWEIVCTSPDMLDAARAQMIQNRS